MPRARRSTWSTLPSTGDNCGQYGRANDDDDDPRQVVRDDKAEVRAGHDGQNRHFCLSAGGKGKEGRDRVSHA